MDCSEATQIALVKASGLQNKTKRQELERDLQKGRGLCDSHEGDREWRGPE